MKMSDIPFATTDWATVPREEKSAQAGQAFWRTQQFGDVRVRMLHRAIAFVHALRLHLRSQSDDALLQRWLPGQTTATGDKC